MKTSLREFLCDQAEDNRNDQSEENSAQEKSQPAVRDSARLRDPLHPAMLLLSHFSLFLDFFFFKVVHGISPFSSRMGDRNRSNIPAHAAPGS